MLLKHFNAPIRKLRFKSAHIQSTSESGVVICFKLNSPIKLIKGSQAASFDSEGNSELITAKNVSEIFVHKDAAIKADEAMRIYQKDRILKFEGSSMLDVARNGRVWLVDKSFAAIRREMSLKSAPERANKIREMMAKRNNS